MISEMPIKLLFKRNIINCMSMLPSLIWTEDEDEEEYQRQE
jgi:hypothetical protein